MFVLYFRKVRLKQPNDLKQEESGFFEKSSDVYDHGLNFAYADRVNSKSPKNINNSITRQTEESKIPKVKRHHTCASPITFEMFSDGVDRKSIPSDTIKLPQHYRTDIEPGHKLNGSVRSNGAIPHHTFHTSSNDDVCVNERYETSKF